MKITQDVRDYVEQGMKEKSVEFVKKGGELYREGLSCYFMNSCSPRYREASVLERAQDAVGLVRRSPSAARDEVEQLLRSQLGSPARRGSP